MKTETLSEVLGSLRPRLPAEIELLEPRPGVVKCQLRRPDLHNALNEELISGLSLCFEELNEKSLAQELRVLVLCGSGESFCAGADLAMMRRQGKASLDENLEDARRLSRLFRLLASAPYPVIAQVQGAAIGGGFGLAVCADFVITHARAVFATTEVRLGLLPAVISPHILRKLNVSAVAPLLLSGQRITGEEAFRLNLAHEVCASAEELPQAVHWQIEELLKCGPVAVRRAKALVQKAVPLPSFAVDEYALEEIASVRESAEAQEGLQAFFEKRKPAWAQGPSQGGEQ